MRSTLLGLLLLLGACGGPKGRPNLPPPEYEEPAPPTATATATPTTSSTSTPAPH